MTWLDTSRTFIPFWRKYLLQNMYVCKTISSIFHESKYSVSHCRFESTSSHPIADPLASSGITTDNVNSFFDGQTEEKNSTLSTYKDDLLGHSSHNTLIH